MVFLRIRLGTFAFGRTVSLTDSISVSICPLIPRCVGIKFWHQTRLSERVHRQRGLDRKGQWGEATLNTWGNGVPFWGKQPRLADRVRAVMGQGRAWPHAPAGVVVGKPVKVGHSLLV